MTKKTKDFRLRNIPKKVFLRFKAICADRDLTMNEVLISLMEQFNELEEIRKEMPGQHTHKKAPQGI